MKILKGSQGIALVVVIMVMAVLLSITGASLLFSGLNLKAGANLRSGTVAVHVADAGIQHALALIPSGAEFDSLLTGTVTGFSCTHPCNGVSNKPTLTGSLSDYTYTVVAENDSEPGGPTNDSNRVVIFTSTATGPNSSKRVIKAYIGRSSSAWTPPGSVYIPGASTSTEVFDPSGTSYTIAGNDTNYDNTAGSQPAITGIAATNSNIVSGILSTLDTDAKKQRVTGAGYAAGPPVTPSVQSTSRIDDVSQVAQNFINQVTAITCPPKCLSGYNTSLGSCPAASPCTLGTDVAPQITYITGQSTTNLGGYVNGSGVLVVKNTELNFLDNFNFHGLVIYLKSATGTTNIEFQVKGNARIYGAVLLGPNNNELEFEMKDTAAIRYSSQAINMVNSNWSSCCLPKPAKLIAWSEVVQ